MSACQGRMQLQTPHTFGLGSACDAALDHRNPPDQVGFLLGALRRQARMIAPVLLAGTAMTVLLGLRAPTLYTARALVAIERPSPTVPHADGGVPAEPVDAATVRAEMQVLNSPEQARLVVEDMDLAGDPEFQPAPPSEIARLRALAAAWMAERLPALRRGGEQEADPVLAASPAEAAAVRVFRTRLV